MDSLLVVDLQNALQECELQGEGERAEEGEDPPSSHSLIPSYHEFVGWAEHAYSSCNSMPAEVSIRLVDSNEMLALNSSFRNMSKTTNVLSFSVDLDHELQAELDQRLLGDVVICHEVVLSEARDQGKCPKDHYAHLVTHGVLHLCGYDHQSDEEALAMETIEQKILAEQGIKDPYA